MEQHSFMVPLRPTPFTVLQFDIEEWEQKEILCIYPLHYNIINHRDKGEKKAFDQRERKEVEEKRDNDASAYTNFETENL